MISLWKRFLQWIRGVEGSSDSRPPIVFTDATGIGWTTHPDSDLGLTPDVGQHDAWKHLMSEWLTAWAGGEPRLLGPDLAGACRRLGFFELARAARPSEPEADLRELHDEHERMVVREANATFQRCQAAIEAGKLARHAHVDDPAVTISILTAGAFRAPEHADRQPLRPL